VAGVYCARCQCKVLLEQDGKSCSNCGAILVGPPPVKPAARKPAATDDDAGDD
jgi:hypothetical protein